MRIKQNAAMLRRIDDFLVIPSWTLYRKVSLFHLTSSLPTRPFGSWGSQERFLLGKQQFSDSLRFLISLLPSAQGLLDLGIQFCLFAVILLIYTLTGTPIGITPWALLTPILVIQLAMLGMGVGIIVSSLTTKYRDLTILVTFGVQLWMYASPIVYSVSQIPERYRFIYLLNPVSPIVTIFRYAFLGTGYIPFASWGISWITTIVVMVIGVLLFSKIEKTFMDTV